MREASKKILLGFLVVTLIAPTLFFERPEKAEALVSLAACFAAKGIASGTALAKVVPGLVTSVSVVSPAEAQISAEGPAGTDWVQCFLNGLAKIIAKTLLHTFTQSIVNWINTGFQGSPSFVTNPEGFLNDVADQAIGRVIEDISPLLCSPFRLDIRFALGLNLSYRNREIHCRLSDVMANVRGAYDGFVQGTIGSGNLSKWIHIAGTPQNNPYGAYIGTVSKLSVGITSATGQQIKLLDWGKGFKSWRSCKRFGPNVYVAGKFVRKGPCVEEGDLKTPGSIIQAQASKALGTTIDELELANEIDEVVGALINQLLTQVMSAGGGLLGASRGDSTNGGISATQALLTDPNAAVAGSDAKPPVGINCSLRYYPSTKETFPGSKIYVSDPDAYDVYTDNLDKATHADTPFIKAVGASRGAFQTWRDYFNEVRAGCANRWNTLIGNASTGGLATLGGGGVGTNLPPTQTPPPSSHGGNIAQNKKTNQSSVYYENGQPYSSEAANDGTTRSQAITLQDAVPWWEVDIGKDRQDTLYKIDEVTEVIINRIRYTNQSIRLTLFVSDTPFKELFSTGISWEALNRKVNCANPPNRTDTVRCYPIPDDPVPPPQGTFEQTSLLLPAQIKETGRYWLIVKDNSGRQPNEQYLRLSDVTIYGKQTRLEGTENEQVSVGPFAFTVSPTTPKPLYSPDEGNLGDFQSEGTLFTWRVSFNPNQSKNGVSLNAQLYRCNKSPLPNLCNESDYVLDKFPNDFNSLTFTYTLDGNSETKKAIIFPGNGGLPTYNHQNPENRNGVDVEEDDTKVIFAKNLSVATSSPINISVTEALRAKMPFRIVIDAEDSEGNQVGEVKADFSVKSQ